MEGSYFNLCGVKHPKNICLNITGLLQFVFASFAFYRFFCCKKDFEKKKKSSLQGNNFIGFSKLFGFAADWIAY